MQRELLEILLGYCETVLSSVYCQVLRNSVQFLKSTFFLNVNVICWCYYNEGTRHPKLVKGDASTEGSHASNCSPAGFTQLRSQDLSLGANGEVLGTRLAFTSNVESSKLCSAVLA